MDKINLHGSWELLLDEEQQGIKEHFYKSETPFPKQIQLPTTISEAKLTPRRDLTSTDHLTDPYAFEGFAWYRKRCSYRTTAKIMTGNCIWNEPG